MTPFPTRAVRLAAIVPALVFPAWAAAAQGAPGAGEDAIVLPRGVLRTSVQGEFTFASETFSSEPDGSPSSDRRPFDFGLGLELAAAESAALGSAESQLRAITGQSDLTLRLGFASRGDVQVARAPILLELGLGARVQLSVLVPYVQTRTTVGVVSADGNTGLNPLRGTGSAQAAALAQNVAVVDQLRQAAGQLETLVSQCAADPAASPSCGAVNANPQGAAGAVAAARDFAAGVEGVYGTAVDGGNDAVPVAGSDAQQAVDASYGAVRDQLATFGVAGVEATGPAAAPVRLAVGELDQVEGAIPFSTSDNPVTVTNRYGIGDVELGAKVLVFDSYGTPVRATAARGSGLRVALGGLVRLPTGEEEDPGLPTDVGVGDGQLDVEGRVAADVIVTPRIWMSTVARYGVQLAGNTEVFVTDPADPGVGALVPVERDPGDYLELEVTPRWAFNRYLTLSGHYRYRRKGEDAVTPRDTTTFDLTGFEVGTEGYAHQVGAGLMLSTLPGYVERRTRWPLDVSYVYRHVVAGGGATTWRDSRHEIALRVYLSLFGPSPRGVLPPAPPR